MDSPSLFDSIGMPPPDAIFGINNQFLSCSAPEKVNLVIGAYRTDEGKPWVLPSVRAAEDSVYQSKVNHEYLPMDGEPTFREAARIIMFGREWATQNLARIATVQSLSGTGGLYLGFQFVAKFFSGRTVYLPEPTWENHKNVVLDCGLKLEMYPYYNPATKGLDYDGLIKCLTDAPSGSVILLHAVAHNPTGVDPTPEEWNGIVKVIKEKNHMTYFDSAYQGFASGSLEKDSYAIKLWIDQGLEFFVSQSFAKNFGLYGTRTGAFHVVTKNANAANACSGQLKRIVRAMYSNPPNFGARLISTIVHSPELYAMWQDDLKTMSNRLFQCRQMLFDELKKLGTPGDWTHILKQIGMFTYTGLTSEQCENLMKHYHVYLLKSGRVSLAGINTGNVAYVARAIDGVVTGKYEQPKL